LKQTLQIDLFIVNGSLFVPWDCKKIRMHLPSSGLQLAFYLLETLAQLNICNGFALL
jgi:hypothetical protein